MRIEQRDLDKHPHLRAKLGLPEQPAHSADDKIIPAELWREPEPLPPIVVHYHGSDRIVTAAVFLVVALMLAPLGIILGILGMHAPAMFVGIGIGLSLAGAFALYRKEQQHNAERQ